MLSKKSQMTPGPSKTHADVDFEAEMRELSIRFASMSSRCQGQLQRALDAFWGKSTEKMTDVERGDREIDDDEKSIDELLLRILALRHPVASDLRTVTASLKLVTDLERIGDEAVNLAESAETGPLALDHVNGRIRRMATVSEGMLDAAVSAFLERDDQAAERALRTGDVVAPAYREVVAALVHHISEHPDQAAAAIGAMNVARCLERVASHARNIAEGARFAVRDEQMPR